MTIAVIIYTIIYLKFVSLSVSRRSQTAGRNSCARSSREMSLLFASSDSISCHEFASQFGLSFFVHAKNFQNYSEYCVAHASGQLNRTSDAAYCGHGSPPPTSRNGNEPRGGDNIGPIVVTVDCQQAVGTATT